MHFTANRLRWIAVAILLAAFAVRAYNLGGTSLWFDEAVTVINSNHSFVEMIQRARGNNTTPIVLPTLWWLFGDSVHDAYTIRFLPLMFGLLAVALALRLPKVGVAKPAAAITAAWLAFLPVQIQYSQEAREYSLSVLGALLLLYGLLHALRMQQRFPTRLCIAVVLAPNLSYGLLFAATAALGTYAIAGVPTRRASAGRLLVLGGAFAGAALLSYVLLARDQMANAVAGGYNTYLASFFPTDGLVGHVEWLVTSLSGYFYYAFGGWIPALFGAAAIVVYAGGRLRRAAFSDLRVNDVILAAVIVVAAVTVLAAVAGRYPFGGNRQNLFATPWMICAAACAFVEIGARRTSARLRVRDARVRDAIVFGGSALLIGISFVSGIRGAYRATTQDIEGAITAIGADVPDRSIYIDHWAQPAAEFHFPKRKFERLSERQVQKLVVELSSLPDCSFYVVATHNIKRYKTVEEQLRRQMYGVETIYSAAGAVALKVDRCRSS